jgi:hypothetical protein
MGCITALQPPGGSPGQASAYSVHTIVVVPRARARNVYRWGSAHPAAGGDPHEPTGALPFASTMAPSPAVLSSHLIGPSVALATTENSLPARTRASFGLRLTVCNEYAVIGSEATVGGAGDAAAHAASMSGQPRAARPPLRTPSQPFPVRSASSRG